jgi:hypothetical protein
VIDRQDRPPSRTSYDLSYHDYSGGKSNNNNLQNVPPTVPTMFKKSSQNIPKPFEPIPTLQQTSYLANK